MAWNQSELDFFSRALGQTITPEMAAGTLGSNVYLNSETGIPYRLDPSAGMGSDSEIKLSGYDKYITSQYGGPTWIDPNTGKPIQRLTDQYHAGTTDVLDPSQIKYDPTLGVYTDPSNMKQYRETDWGLYLMIAAMGGLAAAGSGLLGPAAQAAVTGAEAASAAAGVAPEILAAQAGVGEMGAYGIGAGIETIPGYASMSATQQAALTGLLESGVPSATALEAVMGGGAISGAAGAGLFGTGITGSQALTGAGIASRLAGGLGGGTSRGGSGGGIDFGGMLAGGANLAYQKKLGEQAVQEARDLAPSMQFTPYSISSGMGRTYVDPATGEMVSELAPEWQGAQDTLLDSFYGNMQYATMDPMEASQYAYNMGSNLNAYQDEQNRLGLENRLLSQGMLGSTGGANQMRAMYDAMNQRDLGREAQSLGLGQDMLSKYQQRGLNAYQPAWNTQTQFANQIGQSGQLGGQAMQGSTNAANLINQANLGRMKMNSTAASSFANNPALSGGINNLFGSAGNLLGSLGNIDFGTGGVNWGDQYPALIDQGDGFNWSGVDNVWAGSDQDMMLNDQWDWSW